jgi:hypothetical protein
LRTATAAAWLAYHHCVGNLPGARMVALALDDVRVVDFT